MKAKTLEQIFDEIKEQGFITESQISIIKRRSHKANKDLFDYSLIETIGEGYGIPVTEEQGQKGLNWLKKFMRRNVYGYREREIIENASPDEFRFCGFYNNSRYGFVVNLVPLYDLGGMEYAPLKEPYILS